MAPLWSNTIVYDSRQETYWKSQSVLTGTNYIGLSADLVGCSMQVLTWTRTVPTGLREDVVETAFHWAVNAGPGAPTVPLSGSQKGSIESLFTAWLTTVKPVISVDFTLRDHSWRDWRADFPVGSSGATKYAPVDRVTASGSAGTGSGVRLPDQCSTTLTQSTSSRRHWGRCYFPGLPVSAVVAQGRLSAGSMNAWTTATRALFNSAAALPAITNPVILSTRHQGIMSIREIHMDDVIDVQRRRRPKQIAARQSYSS